jgi:DNA-binding transcriptional LysR family regulator
VPPERGTPPARRRPKTASCSATDRAANGDLDIAFLGVPESEPPIGVEAVVLGHDEHVLVVPVGHRLWTLPGARCRRSPKRRSWTS